MKIITAVGARPQFIKAATISRAIKKHNSRSDKKITELILHSGQHFDPNMSDVFFFELEIPKPTYHLDISSLPHGAMTGRMIEQMERVFSSENPDLILVYGDTNTTLAAAITASKLHIPVAHIEAGLRSHNAEMPEEINRILTDRISQYLFCPTSKSVENLKIEGFPFGLVQNKNQLIENFGDVMLDAVCHHFPRLSNKDRSQNSTNKKIFCTVHRQENTDDPEKLRSILTALQQLALSNFQINLPLHPRTKSKIIDHGLMELLKRIQVRQPYSYLETHQEISESSAVLTDSGGLQKEAYFHGVPCVTLRNETEWTETVDAGGNILAGSDTRKIVDAVQKSTGTIFFPQPIYGSGDASGKIVRFLADTHRTD